MTNDFGNSVEEIDDPLSANIGQSHEPLRNALDEYPSHMQALTDHLGDVLLKSTEERDNGLCRYVRNTDGAATHTLDHAHNHSSTSYGQLWDIRIQSSLEFGDNPDSSLGDLECVLANTL